MSPRLPKPPFCSNLSRLYAFELFFRRFPHSVCIISSLLRRIFRFAICLFEKRR